MRAVGRCHASAATYGCAYHVQPAVPTMSEGRLLAVCAGYARPWALLVRLLASGWPAPLLLSRQRAATRCHHRSGGRRERGLAARGTHAGHVRGPAPGYARARCGMAAPLAASVVHMPARCPRPPIAPRAGHRDLVARAGARRGDPSPPQHPACAAHDPSRSGARYQPAPTRGRHDRAAARGRKPSAGVAGCGPIRPRRGSGAARRGSRQLPRGTCPLWRGLPTGRSVLRVGGAPSGRTAEPVSRARAAPSAPVRHRRQSRGGRAVSALGAPARRLPGGRGGHADGNACVGGPAHRRPADLPGLGHSPGFRAGLGAEQRGRAAARQGADANGGPHAAPRPPAGRGGEPPRPRDQLHRAHLGTG